MDKKHIISFFLLGSYVKLCASVDVRPNIIFILTDDQPYSLLHCNGNSIIHTPNLDQLASTGVLFTNGHVSSSLSTPSRTCILTGRYERSHGVNFNSGTSLSAEAWNECYPVLLRQNGYYTGYIGKNHTPIGNKGYQTGLMDTSYDYWYGAHRHLTFYPKQRHKIFQGACKDTQVEILEEGMLDFLNPNERNLKGAVSFLNSRPKNQPFFLNICFNLPHGAGTGSMKMLPTDDEMYRSLYRDIDIPLPQNYIAKKDILQPKLPESVFHDWQIGYNYCDTPETLKERNIREMQAVTGIDKLVGKLLTELKNQGIDKNTIIVFTSDHGIFNGEFGLSGKSFLYEKCTKVPMIVYDPRLPLNRKNKINNELVLALDLPATFLDWAGVEIPSDYAGFSLKPMLEGSMNSVRDYLYTENLWSTNFGKPRCESVRNKRWKYIRYYKNNNISAFEKQKYMNELRIFNGDVLFAANVNDALLYRSFIEAGIKGEEPVYEELFDLFEDPEETTNLINKTEYSPILNELKKQWSNLIHKARGTGKLKVDIIATDWNYFNHPQ